MTEHEGSWCRYCGAPIAAGLACKAHADLARAEAKLEGRRAVPTERRRTTRRQSNRRPFGKERGAG